LLTAETRLGQPLTLREPLTVDQLLASPANYAGQTVQVKGKISEVCQMAGCWMQLAGTGKNAVRIKVNDGDIVFPRTSVGKMAVAEGKLSKIEMTKEQAIARAKHEAEERGVKFDPASVKSGSTIYQIQGAGALILE
jgi:Domain of unknown function (DUF4920)